MRIFRWPSRLALAALVTGTAARAHADSNLEKADRLFVEGRALFTSNLLQACAKFEESFQLNPAAIGTMLNIALCDERLGKIASAVIKFSQARDRAKEEGLPEHLRAAEEHLAVLVPSVPHLAIRLTEPLPETTVVVDNHVVEPGALGDITIDPGERIVVVSAPARLPYRAELVIARSEHRTLVVPALARSVTVTSSQRLIGQITTASGGAVVAVGIGLGVYARSQWHKQIDNGNCQRKDDGLVCNPVGKAAIDNARNWGLGGTVVGIAGVAITAVGAYLWYTAPPSSRTETDKKLALIPAATADSLGIVALGRF